MSEVRNCRRCGKIFNYIGGAPICPVCRDEDENDFKRIKEYLYKYPGATLSEVSTELEVSVEKIKKFLKEGRLEIVGDDGNFVLECESCGKSIKTGRFCDVCERSLATDMASTASKMKEEASQQRKAIGMRYLNKNQ